MRARLLPAIGLLALGGVGSCSRGPSEPTQADPEIALPPIATEAPAPPSASLEPEDLEPPETRRGYGARAPHPLLRDVDCEFSMLCMPSFSPAYAVALASTGTDLPGEKFADRHWTLRFTADEPNAHRHLAKREDPRRSAQVVLAADAALTLKDAWESVVRRTRYPRPHYELSPDGTRVESFRVGLDGTSYLFECGGYCGTAWEPKAELTWGITELGDALRDYALADEAQRPKQLAHCLELAKKLQTAAERRPW